jgi:hypothetical protein
VGSLALKNHVDEERATYVMGWIERLLGHDGHGLTVPRVFPVTVDTPESTTKALMAIEGNIVSKREAIKNKD